MLISNAEIEDVTGLDLRIQNGHIQEIGSGIKRQPGEQGWDADGGSVIPGLHDHHIHLYALAAAAASTACGPVSASIPPSTWSSAPGRPLCSSWWRARRSLSVVAGM